MIPRMHERAGREEYPVDEVGDSKKQTAAVRIGSLGDCWWNLNLAHAGG